MFAFLVYLFDKLTGYNRIVPGGGYINRAVFWSKLNPNLNNEDYFFNFDNKIDFDNDNNNNNNNNNTKHDKK
jgi:hypothetical protein